MQYGIFPGGKKIRSKVLVDLGQLFNVNYKTLIKIGAAVECIHAYSLIHDDLPCMDNDTLRRGKVSTHIKYTESTAVLAGNSLLTMAFEILSDKSLRVHEKIKIELIVEDEMVEIAIEAIIKSSYSGKIGDGKIFVSPIEQVLRIRTGEKDSDAV